MIVSANWYHQCISCYDLAEAKQLFDHVISIRHIQYLDQHGWERVVVDRSTLPSSRRANDSTDASRIEPTSVDVDPDDRRQTRSRLVDYFDESTGRCRECLSSACRFVETHSPHVHYPDDRSPRKDRSLAMFHWTILPHCSWLHSMDVDHHQAWRTEEDILQITRRAHNDTRLAAWWPVGKELQLLSSWNVNL